MNEGNFLDSLELNPELLKKQNLKENINSHRISFEKVMSMIFSALDEIPREKHVDFLFEVIKRINTNKIDFRSDDNDPVEYMLVKIVRKTPRFLGVDGRIYRSLLPGTLAYIPRENAKILIRYGYAERIFLNYGKRSN